MLEEAAGELKVCLELILDLGRWLIPCSAGSQTALFEIRAALFSQLDQEGAKGRSGFTD